MIFPDRYKTNKKYPKKLFLENKDIETKDRSFIKKHVISVELSHQIMGEDIPSVDNEDYKFDCTCGLKNCRKIVTGYDWKIKGLQDKYYNYFAQYLKEKIDEERRLEAEKNEK